MYLGDFSPGQIVYIYFNTFDSNDPSASVTITDFINTDVHIHKDDDLTQRNNAAGITVDVDVDAITGSHFIKIDTANNTVADFFTAGHDYFVRIEGTTVDAATINAVVGHFSLDNRMVAGKMVSTDIATLATQTSFTLTVGSADNDAYNGCTAIISDLASGVQKCYGIISDYIGGSLTVTLAEDPGIFTMAAGDNITIIAASALCNVRTVNGTLQTANDNSADINSTLAIVDHADYGNDQLVRSTTPANKLDVSGTGEAGLDFDNIKDATGAHTLTNITVPTCTTNSDMVGTNNAALASVLGAAVGASISADIADVPTVSEFNARTLASADYVITSDTIAGVTTCTNNSDMVGTNGAALASVLGAAVGASISADIADVPTVAEMNARTLASADYVVTTDTIAGVTLVTTTTTNTDVTALNDLSAVEVNAEVVDAIATDTYAEPGQGAPGATISLVAKINFIYKWMRNKSDNDGTTIQHYNDAGAVVDQKRTASSVAGTVTRNEIGTGP